MSAATPARRAALETLVTAEERDAYVRELLDRSSALRALDARDAAFARRLALGVTAARGCLDEALDRFLAKPRKVSPRVRMALRIAAFEFIYLGTAPEVAVSQGVELVRSQARAAAGLANAVLRKVAAGREAFLAADDVDSARAAGAADAAGAEGAAADAAGAIDGSMRALVSRARRAGLPVWLVREIEGSLGEGDAASLLAAELEPAPLAAYVLPGCLDSSAGCLVAPDAAGSECRAGCSDSSSLSGSLVVRDMPGFLAAGVLQRDQAVMSDLNAQRVAQLAVRPGSCLEVGAGRGTKTFVIAAEARRRGFSREHVAIDLYEGKCRENLERLKRAGLAAGIQILAGDGTGLDDVLAPLDRAVGGERRLFDTVLLDAPCSGTGTMRRHPEIPWRLARRDMAKDLPVLQGKLLHEASRRVAPDGRLVYATCSVLRQENRDVVRRFLMDDAGRGFELVEEAQTVPAPGAFDGHYRAVLKRRP